MDREEVTARGPVSVRAMELVVAAALMAVGVGALAARRAAGGGLCRADRRGRPLWRGRPVHRVLHVADRPLSAVEACAGERARAVRVVFDVRGVVPGGAAEGSGVRLF